VPGPFWDNPETGLLSPAGKKNKEKPRKRTTPQFRTYANLVVNRPELEWGGGGPAQGREWWGEGHATRKGWKEHKQRRPYGVTKESSSEGVKKRKNKKEGKKPRARTKGQTGRETPILVKAETEFDPSAIIHVFQNLLT